MCSKPEHFGLQCIVGGLHPAVSLSGRIVGARVVRSIGGVAVLVSVCLDRLFLLLQHRHGCPSCLAAVGLKVNRPRYGGHWWNVALPFPSLRLLWGVCVRGGFPWKPVSGVCMWEVASSSKPVSNKVNPLRYPNVMLIVALDKTSIGNSH